MYVVNLALELAWPMASKEASQGSSATKAVAPTTAPALVMVAEERTGCNCLLHYGFKTASP